MTMSLLDPVIAARVEALGVDYQVLSCNPMFADTAVFCEQYGFNLGDSANCIIIASNTAPRKYAACVLLADSRLGVTRDIRKRLGSKRTSFATVSEAVAITGMQVGGIMPLALPEALPLFIDARVLDRSRIILGSGRRDSKVLISPEVFKKSSQAEIVQNLSRPIVQQEQSLAMKKTSNG